MAPRKLSDSDKSDIIELYRQPGQTTSTLAEQYGVSNSTISRILKTTLPPDEYSGLISQKRMAGSDKSESPTSLTKQRRRSAETTLAAETPATLAGEADPEQDSLLAADDSAEPLRVEPPKLKAAAEREEVKEKSVASRHRRRQSKEDGEQLPLLTDDVDDEDVSNGRSQPPSAPILVTAASDDDDDDDEDDLLGLDETLGDDFGDDDDDEEDEDDEDSDDVAPQPKFQSESAVEIMPLGTAVLPKPCYLVVDMRSELITRPLSEFADLGQIPTSEEKAKTLPVFDNHRVARRFSRNKQRVIKVPDGNIITRTSPYLQAKGITRLLVDGQVYDLVSKD